MAYELNYCRINVPRHSLTLNKKKLYTKNNFHVYRKLSHLKFKKKRGTLTSTKLKRYVSKTAMAILKRATKFAKH